MKTKLKPMSEVGEARLLKLIEFLEVLPKEKFYFGNIVDEFDKKHYCGTVACAIGHCPSLFPDLVEWVDYDGHIDVSPTTLHGGDYSQSAAFLFEIDYFEAGDLFAPDGQQQVHEELKDLGEDATPAEVAAMLRHYIALTKEEV